MTSSSPQPQAREIDGRLLEVWASHPGQVSIDADVSVVQKTARALEALRALMQQPV